MKIGHKKEIKSVLKAGLVITIIVYILTLQRIYGSSQIYFTHPILKPFYLSQSSGFNTYVGGSPFTSETVHPNSSDGCPCHGVNKIILTWRMTATTEFLGNLLVWSIFPATYTWIRRKR